MQSHYSVDQFGREQLKLEITHVKPVSVSRGPVVGQFEIFSLDLVSQSGILKRCLSGQANSLPT